MRFGTWIECLIGAVWLCIGLTVASAQTSAASPIRGSFDVVEATIDDVHASAQRRERFGMRTIPSEVRADLQGEPARGLPQASRRSALASTAQCHSRCAT